MEDIIKVNDIIKRFGDFTAVDSITFSVKKGEIFGILGPNGAGKTTTINMILGILRVTRGSILIDGMDNIKHATEIKNMIGFMTQETVVDAELTAYKNLEIFADLYHIKDVDGRVMESLREGGLTDFANSKAGSFSGGMQRRLNLVKSMIHQPKILILDEPTTGLDVQNRVDMWKRIKALAKNGVTVILTTQYLEEADQLCNRIAIIDHGKIKALGTASELKKLVSNESILDIVTDEGSVKKVSAILSKEFKLQVTENIDRINAPIKADIALLSKIIASLTKNKIQIISIGIHLPTLDDVFIKLTGAGLRDTLGEQQSNRSRIMNMRG
ncbi:MAG: ATP-binding cassette domain-containing protein [Candidatus Marsarchaeota archaeon]|nr:ATP-binding cassette domain-containing protein [Candidatus Marsarchaeota archaeon]